MDAPSVDALAHDEGAVQPPVSVREDQYAFWHQAFKTVQATAGAVEEAIATWLEKKGLTATSVKHIWMSADLEGFEIREGKAPPDSERPFYLQGMNLNICEFVLPGIVIGVIGPGGKKEYMRVRRNLKAGELEGLLRQIENNKAREANHARELSEDSQPRTPSDSGAVL
jgi:hypothetical protein